MPLLLRFDDPESKRPRVWSLAGRFKVGSDESKADLVVRSRTVAPVHAELDAGDATCLMIRSARADALLSVNGRICRAAPLSAGDSLVVGDVSMSVVASPAAADLPRFTKIEPPLRGTRVGRGVDCNSADDAELTRAGDVQTPEGSGESDVGARRMVAGSDRRRAGPSRSTSGAASALSYVVFGAVLVLIIAAWYKSSREVAPVERPPSEAEVIRRALDGVVTVQVKLDQGYLVGAGVVVSRRGHILTNLHVLGGAKEAEVIFNYGERNPVVLARSDEWNDLALLRLKFVREVLALDLADDLPNVGENIYAVGSPVSPVLGFSVTRGIISGRQRELVGRLFIQHDAALNPGNSGGPLLDARGRVLGLNTWKMGQVDGLALQGLGFAIPAQDLRVFLKAGPELE